MRGGRGRGRFDRAVSRRVLLLLDIMDSDLHGRWIPWLSGVDSGMKDG